ncbi:hypothetical protein [Falsigemmobacter faecalis]|uniref:Uncharacterized protein n=1 Tax=Falsigemmobacter faecalis TaxID=2488730 RepID=A0A3P3DDC7_9RHOB|nr:hypothetical protein [Falsigemmobacter faecalis]RRH72325.1 hypothetical protein EG244_15205 [Falsigemmobacter faecalis]
MSAGVAANLHPPRLPEAFLTAGPADYLLAFGLGLLLAGLIWWLIAPGLKRRPPRIPLRAAAQAARDLPPGEGMLALAALAAKRGVELTSAEQSALYAPDPGPAREALAARLSRRGGLR